ncbi:hypothetical protein [Nocardioides daphniae]|uniref:YCII-related domain-containing protein n=1 Tax=Nocardioides daphniae TaxID=402297 RepID=A0A4P7UE05_9ACTN|nr:hypothetical protein [Nocardioides daphniae]QCC78510.1 hypothetical protein E2C04_17240 [Nocardioides daphniae]GGD11804.1 hypothetical protein GCM10007231_08340 [Nocardioides daphniae]
MTRYLITFSEESITFPAEDLRDVVSDAAEVVAAAKEAGVWVLGAGLKGYDAMVVEPDGTLIPSYALLSANVAGFTVVDVDTEEEAHEWARRIAVACRAAQEVRELLDGDAFGRTGAGDPDT